MEEAIAFRNPRWSRSSCVCVLHPPIVQRLDPCLSCSSGLNFIHSWDDQFPRFVCFFLPSISPVRVLCYKGFLSNLLKSVFYLWRHGQWLKRVEEELWQMERIFTLPYKKSLRHLFLTYSMAMLFNYYFLECIMKIYHIITALTKRGLSCFSSLYFLILAYTGTHLFNNFPSLWKSS